MKRIIKCLLVFLGVFFLYDIAEKNAIIIPHEQWYLDKDAKYAINIGVQEMWEFVKVRKNKHIVTVAIIDGGIDTLNPEICTSLWKNIDEIPNNGIDDDSNGYIDDVNGWNFVNNNWNASEYTYSTSELSHGTAIAGIIGANPYIGKVCGIAEGNYVKLMPLKILHTFSGEEIACGSVENLICAIRYAESNGADICNISLNMNQRNEELLDVISNSKMLFIVSAGNRKRAQRNIDQYPSYPACFNLKNVIAVANIKSNGRLNTNSNYGKECVDVAAPGTDIYSISSGRTYSYNSGTSYAAPIVTSMAAVLYMCDDTMTNIQCKQIICQSADTNKYLKDKIHKGRILNCKNAIQMLKKEKK